MDDDTSDPDEAAGQASTGTVGEPLGAFGPVSGSGLVNDPDGGRDGLPWRRVDRSEMEGLLVAYREAESLGEDLLAALEMGGISADEFPELRGTLDGQGRAVVQLGEVSAATGARLLQVLRASPIPPAGQEKAA